MTKDVSFVLDPKGGEDILQKMCAPLIKQSAEAIAARARSMSQSLTSNPPDISVSTTVGTIRKGVRAIATVRASGGSDRANYIGHIALSKAKDAGRVT